MKNKAMIEFQGGGAEHKFSLKGFTLAEVLITLGYNWCGCRYDNACAQFKNINF